MNKTISERLSILLAKLEGNELLKYSSWKDVMHELLKHYRPHKSAIKRRMHIEREGAMQRVQIDGKTVYWPQGASPKRLALMYFEVYFTNNNHLYDIDGMTIKKGDVVLDCGACEGFFTRKALESGAEKVYCIEPSPVLIKCLEKMFAHEIAKGKVSLSSCLLGNKNGRVMFSENPTDPASGKVVNAHDLNNYSFSATEIMMLTIDEFCKRNSIQKLDFIKADVEGSEIDLIYGAEKTIMQLKPALAIAVYHEPENANKIAEFIEGLSLKYTIRVKGIRCIDNIPRPAMFHCYH